MKLGTLSYVVAFDKGSILITLLFSVLVLGETITPRLVLGVGFILVGMLILKLI